MTFEELIKIGKTFQAFILSIILLLVAIWIYSLFVRKRNRTSTSAAGQPNPFKEMVETLQSIVTVIAIGIGGIWTYTLFIKERSDFPHANTEQKVTHVSLSKNLNLLHIAIEVTNVGKSKINLRQAVVRLQNVVPLKKGTCDLSNEPCLVREIDTARENRYQPINRFSWPLYAESESTEKIDIEAGEKTLLDFEFVVPTKIKVLRIYSYVGNEATSQDGEAIGWAAPILYDFRTSKKEQSK